MNTILSPVAEFEASIPCREVTLQGDLSLPVHATGLVIFAHGSGSSRASVRNRLVALEMHRRGLATLLFDLMTPREVEADAGGAFLRFEIPVLTERLIAATRWAQGEDHLSRLPIGYFGSSTGAAAALAAAAALPEIAAVVSRGGRTDLAGSHLPDVKAATLLIVGYQFIIKAMRVGEISFVAPFRYTALLWSIFLGFIVFGDVPHRWTIIGGLIVVGSGLYLLHREAVRKAEPSAPVA